MARQPRSFGYSNIYHIMIRGINKKEIFYDEIDCKKFLSILQNVREKRRFALLAYCLMKNHVHLLIFDPNRELTNIMREIEIPYALYFNKKYNRVGYLFQDRFKSKCVNDTGYLERVIGYIHQNPEKAFICDAEQYKWSSFRKYINHDDFIDYEKCFDLLGYEEIHLDECFKKLVDFSKRKTYNYDEETEYEFERFLTDDNASEAIRKMLVNIGIEDISNIDKRKRKDAIHKIKKVKCISNDQIANYFDMNRNTVSKI